MRMRPCAHPATQPRTVFQLVHVHHVGAPAGIVVIGMAASMKARWHHRSSIMGSWYGAGMCAHRHAGGGLLQIWDASGRQPAAAHLFQALLNSSVLMS